MSAKMVTAHGGNKSFVSAQKGEALVLGGIVSNTTGRMPHDVHMKGLDRLISQTTGVPREEPIMAGVISSTVPMHMVDTPEFHKLAKGEKGKTQAERMGQVPYGGPKY